jgi:hypothetical protein
MLLIFPFFGFSISESVLESRSLGSHFAGQIPFSPSVSSNHPKDFSSSLCVPALQPNLGAPAESRSRVFLH